MCVRSIFAFFFFSSRRRHTRLVSDWSSDVCSSDLPVIFRGAQRLLAEKRPIILCEMHSAENHRVLLGEFARFGYACKSIDEQHVLALPAGNPLEPTSSLQLAWLRSLRSVATTAIPARSQ